MLVGPLLCLLLGLDLLLLLLLLERKLLLVLLLLLELGLLLLLLLQVSWCRYQALLLQHSNDLCGHVGRRRGLRCRCRGHLRADVIDLEILFGRQIQLGLLVLVEGLTKSKTGPLRFRDPGHNTIRDLLVLGLDFLRVLTHLLLLEHKRREFGKSLRLSGCGIWKSRHGLPFGRAAESASPVRPHGRG